MGGPAMVSHTVAELKAAGIPADDIRFENFHHATSGESDGASTAGDEE